MPYGSCDERESEKTDSGPQMTKARHKKQFLKQCPKMAFSSKVTAVRLQRTGRRRKVKRTHRWKRNRANYVGMAIGAGIGIALFAILFLTAPKHETEDSDKHHASGKATNAAGLRTPFLHE